MGAGIGYLADIYRRIVNYGADPDWSFDKRRVYRQLNQFNLFLCFISVSAWPIALVFGIYLGFAVQVAGFILYLLSSILIAKKDIDKAKTLSIITFEIHMFLVSLFAILPTRSGMIPWYSPVFISYMLFPLTAALFDKSVLRHGTVAILQIIALQFLGSIIYKNHSPFFPPESQDVLNLIICIYTIIMGSLVTLLVYSENHTVKNLEIERARQLEIALAELKTSKDMIEVQADELRKVNDSKDKFFSILAHDLKSPFNTVLGFSEVLKEKDIKDPEFQLYAKQIYDTALNNYNLLENLLEWTRNQMNHIRFEPEVLKLSEKVNINIDLLKLSAERKGIEIQNEIDPSVLVRADQNMINTILRNIITNAVKFTRPGGTISVNAKVIADMVEVSISDNGIGMPEDLAGSLFKIENMESRKGTSGEKGTGLGLIICKEFVEMHNGTIRVESKLNQGSTFHFTLPLASNVIHLFKTESQSSQN